MICMTGDIPVGTYDPSNLANFGLGANRRLIPKSKNLDSCCPTSCGDDQLVNASQIKHLDCRDKPDAVPQVGREQRELV
jgi:hypothetical protein